MEKASNDMTAVLEKAMDNQDKSKTEKNLTGGTLDEQALFFHRYPRPGKLEIQATKPLGDQAPVRRTSQGSLRHFCAEGTC